MGKVRERKETGKLYLDFMCEGIRCREQTALPNTAANRKKCEALLQKIEAKILLGDFNYAEFFPGSKNVEKIAKVKGSFSQADLSGAQPSDKGTNNDTPLFPEFADQWFLENGLPPV